MKAKAALQDHIVLKENFQNKNVKFELQSGAGDFFFEYSLTIDYDKTNPTPLQLALKNHINLQSATDWTGIEFLTMVFLLEQEPSNIPEPLYKLFSKSSCTETDLVCRNGLVVTMDPFNMMLLHKPKRTSGKVSNKLG